MTTTPALIVTGNDLDINNDLPGDGFGGRPDNSLPGGRPGRPGRPDQGLPPLIGTWPPKPVTWPPRPPISIDIDDDVGISLPIVLPGSPDNTLPPVSVQPIRPENPIVLPVPPDLGVMVALVLPLPKVEPKNGTALQPALLWYGPGTIPMVVYLGTPATPK